MTAVSPLLESCANAALVMIISEAADEIQVPLIPAQFISPHHVGEHYAFTPVELRRLGEVAYYRVRNFFDERRIKASPFDRLSNFHQILTFRFTAKAQPQRGLLLCVCKRLFDDPSVYLLTLFCLFVSRSLIYDLYSASTCS